MNKTSPNRFTSDTITTLAKRASQMCSNPDCRAPTSGPHTDDTKAINLGEAAHIKGAELGSARYDLSMHPTERSSITNGIWLCSRCHTLIDNDPKRYTVEVLYDWKRHHEAERAASLGSSNWERRAKERLLIPLENESPAAYQIALDQPQHWEHMLTIELLRSKMSGLIREHHNLKRGLVFRPTKILPASRFFSWAEEKVEDYANLPELLGVAFNEELMHAWEPPGDPLKIKYAVDKIVAAYTGFLEWEIDVHFTRFPEECERVKQKMKGWNESALLEIERLPVEFAKTLEEMPLEESRQVIFTITAPFDIMREFGNDIKMLFARGIITI